MPRIYIDLTRREWEKLLKDAPEHHRQPRDHAAHLVARGLGLVRREKLLPEEQEVDQEAFAAA
jgi:hypothetical protein